MGARPWEGSSPRLFLSVKVSVMLRWNLFWCSLCPSRTALPMGSSCRDPPSSAGLPCMSWGALMGSPESLQDKGLNFFSLSSQGRFSSSWATSFGSSPAASFVFGLWGQSCARAARLGSGSGSAAQPGAHSGSHRAARTVIPSAPDVTSSEHRLSCWLWPAPALVAHLPLSVPPTVCLCKHCFCVAIIILSVSLFMLSLTSHLEFACFHQLLQRRKVGRQFSAT